MFADLRQLVVVKTQSLVGSTAAFVSALNIIHKLQTDVGCELAVWTSFRCGKHTVRLQAAVSLLASWHPIEPCCCSKVCLVLSALCSLILHAGNGRHLATSVFCLPCAVTCVYCHRHNRMSKSNISSLPPALSLQKNVVQNSRLFWQQCLRPCSKFDAGRALYSLLTVLFLLQCYGKGCYAPSNHEW